MVKNLSTIDRSEKVRIGKHMPSEQALNSIVLNASSNIIEAPNPGLYMAPIRRGGSSTSNALAYDPQTHEIVDTGLTPETTLQGVTGFGNTTTITTEFNNVATGLVTLSNVGIANANPIHTLDIGSKVSVNDVGSNVLDVRGNVFVSQTTFITGNLHVLGDTTLVSKRNLIVDDGIVEIGKNNYDSLSATDLGFVMTRSPTEANVALGFTETDNVFILAHTQSSADGDYLVPDTSNSISMRVYGNVTADSFAGDGGLLSNIASNLEQIANNGNVTSNTIQLTNATDGLVATGNVTAAYFKGDGSELTNIASNLEQIANNGNVTSNTIRFTNATDGLVATGNVTAAYFKGDGTHVTNVLHMNEFDSHAANIRSEMAANTVTMYSNLSANVAAIRDEMEANTVTMYSNLSANVAAIRDEMAANTVTMYSNLSANVAAIRDEMAANTTTMYSNLSANVAAIRDEMAANTTTMYSNLSANVAAIRTEMTANTLAMQSNLDSNVTRIAVLESEGLSHIVDRNNVSSNTIQLTNATDGLVATGNITASYFKGDGGELTNIASNLEQIVNNGNVSSNTLQFINTGTSLVTSGKVGVNQTTPQKTLHVGGEILADDDITGVDFFGDDATFTGNVTTDGLVATGNVTAAYFKGVGSELTGLSSTLQQVTDNSNITSNTIQLTNATDGLVATGNVTAAYFKGDGSKLTGLVTDLESVIMNGNTTSNIVEFHGPVVSIITSNSVGVKNTNPLHDFSVGTNVFVDDIASNILTVDGNILAHAITLDTIKLGAGHGLETVVMLSNATSNVVEFNNATSFVTASNVGIANAAATHTMDIGANVYIDDTGSNVLHVIGNTYSSIVMGDKIAISNSAPTKDVSIGSNLCVEEYGSNVLVVGGNVSIGTKLTLGSIDITAGQTLDHVVNQSNVTDNVLQLTNITDGLVATGNVTAAYFKGDGSELTGLSSTLQQVTDNSNITNNVVQLTNATDGLVATGNVTAAYFKGDGTKLTGIALATDLTQAIVEIDSNAARVGTLETNLTQAIVEIDSNAARVGTLETNLTQAIVEIDSNAARVGTLETNLTQAIVEIDSNAARVGTLETNLTQAIVEIDSNAARIDTLEDGTMSFDGVKTFTGDVILEANLKVSGNVFYSNAHNLIVSDPIMELGANNQNFHDLGIVMVRHDGAVSNVSMSYDESDDILRFGYTDDSAYESTIANTSEKLAVSITGNVAAAYDTDTTSYFGRAAVGYMGQSDQASFSHLDKNTSTNFALKQAASGATHINTPTGQHIRFSVNAAEVGRFSGGGDFKVGNNPVKFYVDKSLSEVQMYSQATGSTAGPDLVLMRDNGYGGTGSNGDYIGQVRYEGLNDNGGSLLYAKTTGKIKTASIGSEDGVIETMIKTGGSNRISVRHSGDLFHINKGTDFQVGEVANIYVDTSTSRVGIGLSNPSHKLDVSGDINFTGSLLQNGSAFQGSQWTESNSNIYYEANVAIGTSSVTSGARLEVDGPLRLSKGGDATDVTLSRVDASQPTYGDYAYSGAANSMFGHGAAVSADGKTMVVGSREILSSDGGVFVYEGSETNWTLKGRLKISGATSTWNGHTVAVSEDGSVIVCTGEEPSGTSTPKTFIYVRSGSNWTGDVANPTATLTGSHYIGTEAWRADCDISKDGNTIVVGAGWDNYNNISDSGSCAVYVKPSGGWATTSTATRVLGISGATAYEALGWVVRISGDGNTIVTGARDDDTGGYSNNGTAFVYEKGSAWSSASQTPAAMLSPSDPGTSYQFGYSVDISDDGVTIVVGAPYHSTPGSSRGAAYVFLKGSGWIATTESCKITASDAFDFDSFGYDCAISGDASKVFISAPFDDDGGSGTGSCYVYSRPSGNWNASSTLSSHRYKLVGVGGSPGRMGWSEYGSCADTTGAVFVVGSRNRSSKQGAVTAWSLTEPELGFTTSLSSSGDINATGNVTAYSDKRLKDDIEKIENALDKIEKLNGYTYTMKNTRYTGLIAQEVLSVLPEAVSGSEETHYALAYGNMMGLVVEALKEICEKIRNIEDQL